MSTAVDIYWKI